MNHPRTAAVPMVVVGSVLLLLFVGAAMVRRAEARVNHVALASSPQPVTVVRAKSALYRSARVYGGTFESWVETDVGPQFLTAYVESVRVRPGDAVGRGDVLATLDCREASVSRRATALQGRAIAAKQHATQDEAMRIRSMLAGGFVATDEAEQKNAQSAAEEAKLDEQQAKLEQKSLGVNDCVLRAPFSGEVATRSLDPGALVRPGTPIVTILDRSTVRFTADAPEIDYGILKPGTVVRLRVYATGQEVSGTISRRAPNTADDTRTVHFEVDVPDPNHEIPGNTTGEVHIDAGEPQAATEIPLCAALVRAEKAVVFVVSGSTVRTQTFDVKGEAGGSLFVDTSLGSGTQLIVEGRELLQDGDRVTASELRPHTPAGTAEPRGERL